MKDALKPSVYQKKQEKIVLEKLLKYPSVELEK